MSESALALVYFVIAGLVVASLVYVYRTRGRAGTPGTDGHERLFGSATPALGSVSVQGPDFNATSHGLLDVAQTVDLFKSEPWRDHLRDFDQRESSGLEGCPPNLSVVVAEGKRMLQVVCNGPNEFWLTVASRSGQHEVNGLSSSEVESILDKHFVLEEKEFDAAIRELQSSRDSGPPR